MRPLFTETEFKKAKYHDLLPLECYQCGKKFCTKKRHILECKNLLSKPKKERQKQKSCKYCSAICAGNARVTSLIVHCKNCEKPFRKTLSETKNHPNHFCCHSCAATYTNTHKTKGYRRSKLEIWLESQLPVLYPSLKFIFNDKITINSELDIFIPTLKLAFELNGIFHYEPIYGKDKLSQIKNNDRRKFQACLEEGIELCIIDVSTFKYFKSITAQKYLDIIRKIIDNSILNSPSPIRTDTFR
jgi:hypothetical protein